MDTYIEKAKIRSYNYGILPDQKVSKKVVSERELDRIIKENQELITVANPFVNQLYSFVKDTNFLVILTDGDGCILNIIGNEDMIARAYDTFLIPGAYMGEQYVGTNGMGTCIFEGYPLQVTGEEHQVEIFHGWTCSGAPIRNPKGDIIGCIDLTGDMNLVNSHTLGMVAAAGTAIENMLALKESSDEINNSKNYIETIVNSIPSAIFSTTLDGKVKLVNDYTYDLLGYDKDEFKKLDISRMFLNWEDIVRRITTKESIFQDDVYVNIKANKNEVNLSAYPVNDVYGKVNEIVFVVKDVKKMRKLANKVTGSLAIYTFDKVIGEHEEFLKTISFAKKIADSKSTILIMGESGTGKEIFAQAIQNASNRKKEPFVALNCGAIPKNLIESELFGYEGGAFTGAKPEGHPGKFEVADGGTLFLDEIGEMPYELQTRLLRVIEEGTVRRIGGSREIPIDVRIIAATNRNLREEMEKGNFRKDLYYRLNVLPLRLPPLRERVDDIPLLFNYFMERKANKLNKKMVQVSEDYMDKLKEYSWPGNIRELENMVELIINTESIPMSFQQGDIESKSLKSIYTPFTLEEVEVEHIKKTLAYYEGNITKAANALGISRNTLYRKIEGK